MAPPTVNTNSSTVWVTFRSDGSIGGSGFIAQYHAITLEQSEYWVRGRINRHTELIFASGNMYFHSTLTYTISNVCVCSQRAAPGRSLCVTMGAASCLCQCVTASPTVMTTLMRPTAATSTKVRTGCTAQYTLSITVTYLHTYSSSKQNNALLITKS